MVEFVGLFLGLLTGPIEVAVRVDPKVAAVALELDGTRIAELSDAPWRATVDLGAELRPHRLQAVAFDAHGTEVDRATRYLNVYRPAAGLDYALHRNRSGWVTMIALSPTERGGARPRRSAVAVDGQPIDFEDPASVWLPPLDPSEFHVIETVVEYTDGSVTRDRIGVGGAALGDSSARVTAVAVAMPAARAPAEASAATARVAATGERPRVLGIERGEAEFVFVRDLAAARAVRRIGPARPTMGALGGGRDAQAARVIRAIPLQNDEWARVLDPTASAHPGPRLDPHAVPAPLLSEGESGFGLFWHLKQLDPELAAGRPAWISDALAIAAGRLAVAGRRRAVVLVLAPESADQGSRLSPPAARRYLEALGVPLHVWYVGKPSQAPDAWGPAVALRSLAGMKQAMDDLRAALGRQRIVWVEGIHLPGEVEIELPAGAGAAAASGG